MNYLSVDNLILETVGEELAHLPEDKLVDLINKYKNGEIVDKLLKEFNINIRSTMLIRSFPLVRIGKCPNCPADIGCSIANKSSSELLNQNKQECWNCGHKPNIYNCKCSKCSSFREQEKIQDKLKMQKELEIKNKLFSDIMGMKNMKKLLRIV